MLKAASGLADLSQAEGMGLMGEGGGEGDIILYRQCETTIPKYTYRWKKRGEEKNY